MEGMIKGALAVHLTMPPPRMAAYGKADSEMIMVMLMAMPMTATVVATATEQLTELVPAPLGQMVLLRAPWGA